MSFTWWTQIPQHAGLKFHKNFSLGEPLFLWNIGHLDQLFQDQNSPDSPIPDQGISYLEQLWVRRLQIRTQKYVIIMVCILINQVPTPTRTKSKSYVVVKHQGMLKATSNVKWLFKSGALPLYCSLVTFMNSCTCTYMACNIIALLVHHYLWSMLL